jgi:predicted AlkP superfamily pyrophosphatase or phosphodiesterase
MDLRARCVVAGWAVVAFVWVACPGPADASSPDFELRADRQELELARSGARSSVQLPVTIDRLMPGGDLPIQLTIAPRDEGAPPAFDATLDAEAVALGGWAFARKVVNLTFQTRAGTPEATEALYVLTAASPTGTRELRFRVVVDESDPLISLGRDELNRPERSEALARGGRALFHLRLSNAGVLPGFFYVTATVPPDWLAGFPDRPAVTKYVGSEAVDLELHVQAPEGLSSGSRATVRVRAKSLRTQETSELELDVENGGHMHVASATGVSWTHLVPPGGETSWVAALFPFEDGPRRVGLTLTPSTPGWGASLSAGEVLLDPSAGPVEVTAFVRAPPGAPAGTRGGFALVASSDRGEVMTTELEAQVTALPRIYIVAVDALNEEYLQLDRAGTGPGSPGDWLMPRIRELMQRGTAYANARSNLPAATDMNHVDILCGTHTGTAGVPTVRHSYGGRDALGLPVVLEASHEMLRFGPSGERVVTLFEGVRTVEPLARGAIVSGKAWVNDLVEDGGRTVQISAAGDRGPDYVGRPEPYVLGDPPSDPDGASDPPAHWTIGDRSIGEIMGASPAGIPSDAYIMGSALRVIAHEDPEVMYVVLGNMDYAQHAMGNASNLQEWDERGTPSTWDDVDLVNELATREEVLDTAREADDQVGRFLDFLAARGRLDGSLVVVTADHGQVTHPSDGIRIDVPLRQAGVAPAEVAAFSGSSLLFFFDLDAETSRTVEAAFEPVAVVYDRDEMQTGVDEATGEALALPDELYSEFWVGEDASPAVTYRWPSLFVFLEGNQQFLIDSPFWLRRRESFLPPTGKLVGGHGGPATQHVPVILAGPGIAAGVVRDEAVRSDQIVPTLYELLRIAPPASVDDPPLP